jgi:autotransporter-associated beta strand protein
MILAGGVTVTGGELNIFNTITIDNFVENASILTGKTGGGTLILSGQASGTSSAIFSEDDGILAFDSDTPIPAAMTLRVTGGAVEAINNPHIVSNPLSITGDANFTGTEPLTFSNATGNTLGTSTTRAIYVNDSEPVTINNLNAQQSTLIAGGPGTLVLAGNPSNLIATQITGGTLQIQNPNAPGASLGSVTISNLATLNLNNYNATTSSLSGSGSVQLGSGTLATQSGSFSGSIGGTGNLVKSGSSLLALSGTNSYSGSTTLSGGTLNLGTGGAMSGGGNIIFSGGTLQYSAFNTNDYSSNIVNSTGAITIDTNGQNVTYGTALAGSNAGGLTKAGNGTLTISGASAYSGATVVTGGTLIVTQSLTTSSSFSVTSGATLDLSSGNFSTSGTITNNGTLVLGSGVTLGSSGTFTNNGTLDLRNDPSFIPPSNFINNGTVLTAPVAYSIWTAQQGLTGSKALQTAVISHDGLDNLYKYALGLAPNTNYNPDASGLPSIVTTTNISGNQYLTLSFDGVETNVTYTVQATSNFSGGWTTIQTFPSGGTAPGTVTVQDSQPMTASSERFMRLLMTRACLQIQLAELPVLRRASDVLEYFSNFAS